VLACCACGCESFALGRNSEIRTSSLRSFHVNGSCTKARGTAASSGARFQGCHEQFATCWTFLPPQYAEPSLPFLLTLWYSLSPQTQDQSIEDQAARQLQEVSLGILAAVDSSLPDEDLKPLTALLRNLRLHCTRKDVQRIVDESNKKVLEAVSELLQAVAGLGTRQSTGQRLLARELAGLTVRIPSHAVLLPPRDDESLEMTETEREASSWIQRLKNWRANRKKKGKGVVSKEYRLFFLCGHDRSLAECGFEGKGYRIKCPREWVKRGGLPIMKALLIVVNIALKTVAGLSIPADGIASAGGKAWGEILSTIEGAAEASIDVAFSTVGERLAEASATADQTGAVEAGHDMADRSNVSSEHRFWYSCLWRSTQLLGLAV